MARRRPLYISSGRNPFEVFILGACTLVGGTLAATGVRPPSLTRGLPEPLLTVWLVMISLGGLVALAGVFWRRGIDDGLIVEFAGCVAISCACSIYVAALFALNRPAVAFASAGLLAGIAAGAGWRAGQCARDWWRIRRAVPARVRVDLPLLTEPHDEQGPA